MPNVVNTWSERINDAVKENKVIDYKKRKENISVSDSPAYKVG